MVKRRQGFTLMETLVSLLIVLTFCELAALVVHHAVASKDTQGLGADQFSWYLATSQLTEYLYDKRVISV